MNEQLLKNISENILENMNDNDAEVIKAIKRQTRSLAEKYIDVCCIVRTYSAGVFVGTIKETYGTEVIIADVFRLWRWKEDNFTLSEVSQHGVHKTSRISQKIPEIFCSQMIEIIPITASALATFAHCAVEVSHKEE